MRDFRHYAPLTSQNFFFLSKLTIPLVHLSSFVADLKWRKKGLSIFYEGHFGAREPTTKSISIQTIQQTFTPLKEEESCYCIFITYLVHHHWVWRRGIFAVNDRQWSWKFFYIADRRTNCTTISKGRQSTLTRSCTRTSTRKASATQKLTGRAWPRISFGWSAGIASSITPDRRSHNGEASIHNRYHR